MSFKNLEIITVLPHLAMTRESKIVDIMSHINQGERYVDKEVFDSSEYTPAEFVNGGMNDELHTSELECVEAYGTANGLIDSEQAMSDRYDQLLIEFDTSADELADVPMMREGFSNYMDNLHCDGELHETQVNQYDYCGKHDF